MSEVTTIDANVGDNDAIHGETPPDKKEKQNGPCWWLRYLGDSDVRCVGKTETAARWLKRLAR